jgi:hypothetical protein
VVREQVSCSSVFADQAAENLSKLDPVPGQQGSRCYDPVQPQLPGQQPGQGGEHGTISPARLRTRDLPTQDRDLVPQDQDLRILGGVAADQERQPTEHPDYEQVDKVSRRVMCAHRSSVKVSHEELAGDQA